jgi:hypothetical protein
METSSPGLPSVAEKPATLFVALELSKSTWLVAIHLPAARFVISAVSREIHFHCSTRE